jgi:GT2 family glycosyltransferase
MEDSRYPVRNGAMRVGAERVSSEEAPSVGIVVLNYQSENDTAECVRRLREQHYPNYRIVIVDNASADGAESRLRAVLPEAAVVQRGRNLGYGDGNNLGIEMALAQGADLIWIVSPDVHVAPDCLRHMVALMERRSEIGICCPVVHIGQRAVRRWVIAEGLGSQAWARTVRASALSSHNDHVETGFVEGGALLMRSNVVRQVGGFRTDLFLYYEDCELSLRAKDAGWKLAICMDAHVSTHWNDGTRNRRYYYMTRNSIVLARLRHSFVWRAVARNLLLLRVYMVVKRQPLRIGITAVRDGLRLPLDGRNQ